LAGLGCRVASGAKWQLRGGPLVFVKKYIVPCQHRRTTEGMILERALIFLKFEI
jgi:hypothetical protein